MIDQNLILRPEREEDQKIVENVTREAFWNHHGPGCNEHYLLHVMRQCDAFIPELNYIAEVQGDIVGNIVYTHSKILGDSGKTFSVISFGPISVLPSHQGKGIGKALIEKTKIIARSLGYQAILIYGDPEYYKKVGFKGAEAYGIGTPAPCLCWHVSLWKGLSEVNRVDFLKMKLLTFLKKWQKSLIRIFH